MRNDSLSRHTPALPPLLIGAALLLWGYRADVLPLAIPLALAYEIAPMLPWRWRFSAADFNRLVDLSAVLFIVAALYQFDQQAVHGVYGLLQWLPGLLALLLLCQRYSSLGRVPLGALFLRVRRAVARGEADAQRGVDFSLPFLSACLLSASASGGRSDWLFFAVAGFAAWALYTVRGRRHGLVLWLLSISVVVGLAWGAQSGLKSARRALEPVMMEFLREYMSARRNPFKHSTAIGELGSLKQSERIELRITPDADGTVPDRLIEATYRQFSRNIWVTGSRKLDALRPTNGGLDWDLRQFERDGEGPDREAVAGAAATPSRSARSLHVSRYMPSGRGLLAVPRNTQSVTGLGVEGLSRHRLGALRVQRGPDWIEYQAHWDPEQPLMAPPEALDLSLPREYRPVLKRWLEARGIPVRAELSDAPLVPSEPAAAAGGVVAQVMRGLADGYRYSVELPSRVEPLPLARFLMDSRVGHCEFFATSTVLLLRAAGVPARYETGYAIGEWSELHEAFVARRRHAHAWASAYVNGQWIVVDTTPPSWFAAEAAGSPWWGDIYDLVSGLYYKYSQWRWRESEEASQPWLLWAALPLIGYLLWRLRAERVSTAAEPPEAGGQPPASPLLDVLEPYEAQGHGRRNGETLPAWLARLQQAHVAGDAAVPDLTPLLREALPLHLALRFDPNCEPPAVRQRLLRICEHWQREQA